VTLMDRNYSKAFKNDPLIKNEITYEINDKGISQKLSGAIAKIEWKDILLAIEEKDMFRLYVSKNKAIILPFGFFNSTEEINILKRLIRGNMKAKKVKLK
ncbi:YcxB family protein, partial [Bacillus sp. JJ1521]|uniref:YcxB family protein n=1 Tax=Bacillus sp. JJ1521 TaxID=3122957 RepID=UPI002FFDCD89